MTEREYVLGTGDVEIRRLGVQHAAWRDIAAAAWDRAGIGRGHAVVDLGCGPGYATLDLAERVGPAGRVVAIDKSQRFLDHLRSQARSRGLANIECVECDLDIDALPAAGTDFVWSRWVFIFVRHPRALLEQARALLKPGGALVLHEYVDYASWRADPPAPEIEAFVQAVIASWHDEGGDANVAARLEGWLRDGGVADLRTEPIRRVVRPGDPGWRWLRSYLETGPARLVELGKLDPGAPARIMDDVRRLEGLRGATMTAPTVLEIIARA